jgi:phosphoglycerate dehydrogenase-like enzyme
MTTDAVRILVLREGAEGLSSASFADQIRERLPQHEIHRAKTPAEERRYARNSQIITGNQLRPELLEVADDLKIFACSHAGTDHLPLSELASRGVTVTNASGIHTPGIAEQAIGNILIFARNHHVGWRRQQKREWRHYQSLELSGATVTIVGLGSIGTAITKRLAGFEVETIGVRYTPAKGGPTDEVIGFSERDFHEALSRTEYVILACPLTEETRELIDEEALLTLPPQAVVTNVARGEVIDTDALVTALRRGRIRGAALDVTSPEPLPQNHPLWGLENCLITPHVGGHNPSHWSRLASLLEHNVRAYENGNLDDLDNVVVAPRSEHEPRE